MIDTTPIDGDFPSAKGDCEFHCSPSCHPAQIDPDEWHYGCTHRAWTQNRAGDFCPIVECKGVKAKCEIPPKFLRRMAGGRRAALKHTQAKEKRILAEIEALDQFRRDPKI